MATFPFPWNETVNNAVIDLQFKIRGERQLSEKIVIVFIGPEDVKSLGWPVTRDYYGYITHILKQANAKVISFGILFDTKDNRYPEYDESLAEFFHLTQNVCLPLTFSEMKKTKDKYLVGENPSRPIEKFRSQVHGIGFSTLPEETILRKVPLVVKHGDSLQLSFGCELARMYLGGFANSLRISKDHIKFLNSEGEIVFPIDKNGFMRLNHFGEPEKITSISFVDLIQRFRTDPDSIDFTNKLVLVSVTSPGIAPQKVTPLASAFPATFIHATVAENLIEGNSLKEISNLGELFIIVLLLFFLLAIWKYQRKQFVVYSSVGVIIIYWTVALFAFGYANYILPLFYPTVFYFTAITFFLIVQSKKKSQQDISQRTLLEEQIEKKQRQLKEAEVTLAEMQQKLNRELQEKREVSEEAKKLLEENKYQVIKLENQLRDLQTYQKPEYQQTTTFPDIIHADNSQFVQVLDLVEKIGSDDISVLISGETGTGKEVIARAIHQSGKRNLKPFVAVNCGALPETLLESELFGHEKGSFTGATSLRKGRFELANGGTIFLDEITETSPAFQAKLLRVLQENIFERLGGEKSIKVNVRVIAASSKDLRTEVQKRNFREDLFYRLNGFPIVLPPLRDRKEDIPLLINHFLKKHNYETISGFSEAAMNSITAYSWPGNVRELENMVRRSAILAQSENRSLIQTKDLPAEIFKIHSQKIQTNYQPFEEQILELLRSLKFSHSAISQTAKVLGDRDRGTITEYFRGICFENIVKTNFNLKNAVQEIAFSSDGVVLSKVKSKLEQYLKTVELALSEKETNKKSALFKGLPQKYHPFLDQILDHLEHKKITFTE